MARKKKKETQNLPAEPSSNVIDRQVEYIKICNEEKTGDKSTLAVQLYLAGIPTKRIVKETGLAKNSVYRILKRYREKPEFRQRVANIADYMPQLYLTQKKLEVLKYNELDGVALEEYRKNPDKLLRHPGYMRQLKQSAGVAPSDAPQTSETTVNVDRIQVLVRDAFQSNEAPDAEAIGAKQIEGADE